MNDYGVFAVHVFQKDLAAVWHLLAQRNPEAPGGEDTGGAPPAGEVGGDDRWSDQDLEALYRRCKPAQRAILVRIAQAAGTKQKFATYQDLMDAVVAATSDANFTWANLIANLAWISKYAVKVKGTAKWPATFTKLGTEGPRKDRYALGMNKQTAESVLRISRSIN